MQNVDGIGAAREDAPLSSEVPALSPGEACALARRLYGLDVTAHLLTSERDQNFHLRADGGSYLLKVSNPSEPVGVVDLQTAALQHIARVRPEQPVPRVIPATDGSVRTVVTLSDGRGTVVRLLSYLEGVQARGTPRTPAQRRAMGAALAALDGALADFHHPGADHDLLWNACRAGQLVHLAANVSGSARQVVVRHFLDRFDASVAPRLEGLRRQVIHNDYHLYNVLVAQDDATRVTGIIDFGDMILAPLIGEVATAAAYQMADADDPLAGAGEFVAAYHAALPLDAAEQEVVADLVACRHLVTVLISEWRAARYPHNRDYIMRHNPEAWRALFHMADLSQQQARDRLLAGLPHGDAR